MSKLYQLYLETWWL